MKNTQSTLKALCFILSLALCLTTITTTTQAQRFWWQKDSGETKNVKKPPSINSPLNLNNNNQDSPANGWNRLAYQNQKSKTFLMRYPGTTEEDIAYQTKALQDIKKVNEKNKANLIRMAQLREINQQRQQQILENQNNQSDQNTKRVYKLLDDKKIPTKPRVFRTSEQ